jgi:hypothetical protein
MIVTGHLRDAGAAVLLRKIADVWENGAGYRRTPEHILRPKGENKNAV